ncbi:hypothetical protein [Fischerella sp. PCC 9605]|uniref:hypothetical protein n=1 Tax=Fischerella sp. PCC 9605 TaxID=1173024 RepID=UPI0004B00084|nr:hypothetical protein [Fischerella sp. PCC 9605]
MILSRDAVGSWSSKLKLSCFKLELSRFKLELSRFKLELSCFNPLPTSSTPLHVVVMRDFLSKKAAIAIAATNYRNVTTINTTP